MKKGRPHQQSFALIVKHGGGKVMFWGSMLWQGSDIFLSPRWSKMNTVNVVVKIASIPENVWVFLELRY